VSDDKTARWADSQAETRPPAVEAFRHAFLLAGGPIGAQDEAIRAGLDAALRESGTAAALSEVADLRALFAMQWDRMAEATARWRAEDPEARALIMPDLGDLLQWLMDDTDRARAGGWYLGHCGNEREPDGEVCTADLYAATRTDVQVQCPGCGAWQGVRSPGRMTDTDPTDRAAGCVILECRDPADPREVVEVSIPGRPYKAVRPGKRRGAKP
jgi:hypothetical protein